MFFDVYYLVLVLPAVILAMWASNRVNRTFRKYSQQLSIRRLTGADAARMVLDANGLHQVRIERVACNLTDHYDPRTNVIRLSDSVYDNASTAAIGVAALEQGHLLNEDEMVGARKTLWAAAMTYVAALVVSLAQLFRLLLIVGNRRRND